MSFKSRKFYVWFVSLIALLAIYLLVNRLSQTPRIHIDAGAEFTDTVAENDVGEFGDEIGMVGDVGVGTVRKAKYTHLNNDGQVDREFGFEKLLHAEGNEWEIEKPFMNIFRRNFKCYITADNGRVQVETVVGRASPKDATLTGNVVIHILPENSGESKESFVYLDDIVFISEKSQFSTAGPVKFVSKTALMLGRGLELVYNDELDRLEFLRIIHLDSLHLKTTEAGLFSRRAPSNSGEPTKTPQLSLGEGDIESSSRAASGVKTKLSAKSAGTDASQKTEKIPVTSAQADKSNEGERYKCLFSTNVVIDTPQQLIFADEVFINDIVSNEGSDETDTGGTDSKRVKSAGEKGETLSAEQSGACTASVSSAKAGDLSTARHSAPDESPQQSADTVVTCDNGIFVIPLDSTRTLKHSGKVKKGLRSFDASGDRTMFVAQRIDYSASAGDTAASGPSELTFYVDDIMGAEPNETAVPVKITAQKKAKFLPALNQAVFEGDTLCKMVRTDPNIQQRYTLSAPKLTVNLSSRKAEQSPDSAAGIEHLNATGGRVKLATVKTAGKKLLGGIELKCRRFDYDAGQQLFLASGPPSVIKVDNSNISKPKADVDKFSLQKQCYAFVRNFETLRYSLQTNRIIADAGGEGMLIDYFPIGQGQEDQHVAATASHIEALVYETAGGRTELSTFSAGGGITYEDEDKQFMGSDMFYDANDSIITVWGNESQPCLLNGALVDGIRYDLKTGRVNADIVGPGALQMKPIRNPK